MNNYIFNNITKIIFLISSIIVASLFFYINAIISTGAIEPEDVDTDSRIAAVKTFINTGKTEGWWDKISVAYLPIWNHAIAAQINLRNPTE